MRVDLQSHPKVVRIMSALQADKYRVIGGLHAVWSVFDAHAENGILEGYSIEIMDSIIGWPGFSSAMSSVSWLVETDESLVAPEFDTHNGQSAKRRCLDSERKRNVRKMSASEADKMTTREEKRREEGKPKDKPKAESATATRLPADWSMSVDDCEFCTTTRPDLSALETAARFRDYWSAVPGAKGKKLDWQATWRNWVRNEKARGLPNPARKTLSETRADTIAALTGKNQGGRNERDIPGTCERITG